MKNLIYSAFFSFFFISLSASAGSAVYVVGNFAENVKLSKDEISNFYLGYSRRLPGEGDVVTLTSLSDKSSTSVLFYKMVIGRSVSAMKSHWSYLVFTGKGSAPNTFSSEMELTEFLEKTPNSIGYLSEAPKSKQLKILLRLE